MAISSLEHGVRVRLSHMKEIPLYQEEVPYEIWAEDVKPDVKRTNVQLEIINDVDLTDVRTMETKKPTLDTNGFEYIFQKFPEHCDIKTVDDIGVGGPKQAHRIATYLDCMTGLLQDTYNCTKVVCFDWRVGQPGGTYFKPTMLIYSRSDALLVAFSLKHQTSTVWRRNQARSLEHHQSIPPMSFTPVS